MNGFKKKEESIDDIKKALGEEPTRDKKLSRKEAKKAQKKLYDIEQQKDAIIALLKKANARINTTSHYEEGDRVLKIILNLKSREVDPNARAVYALDGFIKKYCAALDDYCADNNYFGIKSALRKIETLVSERGHVTHKYYEDEKYITHRVKLMELEVNVEKERSIITSNEQEYYEIQEKFADSPEALKRRAAEDMDELAADAERRESKISEWNERIATLKTELSSMEAVSVGYLPEEIVDEFGQTYEKHVEYDGQTGELSKWNKKMKGAGKNNNEKELTVSDAPAEKEKATIDLKSKKFRG